MRRRNLKIVITAVFLLGGVGLLVYASFRDREYYKMVDEVMAKPGDWVGKRLQIHGYVEAGSRKQEMEGNSIVRTFVLEKDGHRILVRHKGPVPDTYKDRAEVVAQGKLTRDNRNYVFISSKLTAQCPSKYEEAKKPGRGGGDRELFQ